MSQAWLEKHVSKAVNYAGPKYTPALDVPVATSAAFHGLTRDEEFFARVYAAQRRIRKCHTSCTFDYQGNPEVLETLTTAFAGLEALLARVTPSEFTLPLSDLGPSASSLERLAREARHRLLEGESRHSTYWLGELAAASMSLREVCEEPAARLANNPFMLLSGSGGSGKTHLICDVAVQRAKRGAITLVFFGDRFRGGDVWAQILGSLGLPITTSDDLLGRLNELGEGSGQRSLIVFDAINEGPVRSGWRRAAREIIRDVRRYPFVGVCFAIRAGFEPAVLDEGLMKLLVVVDHPGFGESEWDAVEAYFHAYHLPLPEIPLVADEFQNPLFLKLFCEAFRGSKRSFRGHYGATHVFEAYAKACGKKVGRDVGVTSQPEFVWKRILKPCAEWMGRKGASEIPMVVAHRIAEGALAGRGHELLAAVEHNALLLKHPRLNKHNRVHHYVYAFPYQKFSDHLIVRYLLNAHLNPRRPALAFRRNRRLGKLARNPFERGLVEALATQVPERVSNELPALLDDKAARSNHVVEAFIESLVWREPRRTNNATLEYINSVIGHDAYSFRRLLEAWVTIAPVPDHAFNAARLHKFLIALPLPRRDSLWTTALHWNYEPGSAVDRLIRWTLRTDTSGLTGDSTRLLGLALAWCLTASHRGIRDTATKALVSLYGQHIDAVPSLLDAFEGVDDPYVAERLMAVAYGAATQSGNKEAIGELAQHIFDSVFAAGAPPSHILLRDYARGVVEWANHLGVPPRGDLSLARPPYSSQWPSNPPERQALEDQFDTEEYRAIWHSVMDDGDFSRHVMDSELSCWIDPRTGDGKVAAGHDDAFDLDFAHRWVFSRVIGLGWQPALFDRFDEMVRYRSEDVPRAERVGKKYQWIAYHELLGFVGDHFEFDEFWDENTPRYDGPWNPHIRDIDPTCLMDGTEAISVEDSWVSLPRYSPDKETWVSLEDWIRQSGGVGDPPIPVFHRSPDGTEWIALGGYLRWAQQHSAPEPEDAAPRGLLRCALKCYAVRRDELEIAYQWAARQRFKGPTMLELRAFHEVFLREFPWAPSYQNVSGAGSGRESWTEAWHGTTMPVQVMPCVDAYLGESSTQDYSVEESISLRFPAGWIFRGLDLSYGPVDGEFVCAGHRFSFNPRSDECHLVLAATDVLMPFLDSKGLELLWTVEGEKLTVGQRHDEKFGRLNLSGAYRLRDGGLEGHLRADLEE